MQANFIFYLLAMLLSHGNPNEPVDMETHDVFGIVQDEEGVPVPNVQVTQLNTDNSVITDKEGRFELQVDKKGRASLIVNHNDYYEEKISILRPLPAYRTEWEKRGDIYERFIEIILRPKVAERTITGHVFDESGEALIGANVLEKGTKNGITTDFDGYFELRVSDEKTTLVVAYIGYMEQEVVVKKGETEVKVIMKAEAELLEEVAVVGYSVEKERPAKAERSKDRKGGRGKKAKSYASAPASDIAYDAPTEAVRTEAVTRSTLSGKAHGVETTAPTPDAVAPPPPPPAPKPEPAMDKVDAFMRGRDVEDLRLMEAEKKIEVIETSADDFSFESADEDGAPADVGEAAGPGGGGAAALPAAGQLTAGILNDFGKWNLWQDIQESELKEWQQAWEFRPWDRYTLQLTTKNGYPIVNATAKLISEGKTVWEARTDNTGKAELWANMFEDITPGSYSIEAVYKGKTHKVDNAKEFHEGINILSINEQCGMPKKVDIAFVVDATGSMSDEIDYLKSELSDVITRSKENLKGAELRLGSVFYRDHGDAYLTRKSHFSKDIDKTVKFIQKQGAAGGGDGPEAIEEALEVTLNEMAWSDDAAARLVFLVLDAPPHQTDEIKTRLKKQIEKASRMGIRIIPVACSGTGRSNEYLMRSFCLATNGSYIYLTDDSGIGGSHLKPVTDEHKVTLLNDILVKTITEFSTTISCDEQIPYAVEEVQDTMEVVMVDFVDNSQQKQADPQQPDWVEEVQFSWKYYPNPSLGDLWIEMTNGELDYLYLLDGAGKLVRRIAINDRDKIQLDLRDFPSGIYFLKGVGENDKEVMGKVILARTY